MFVACVTHAREMKEDREEEMEEEEEQHARGNTRRGNLLTRFVHTRRGKPGENRDRGSTERNDSGSICKTRDARM